MLQYSKYGISSSKIKRHAQGSIKSIRSDLQTLRFSTFFTRRNVTTHFFFTTHTQSNYTTLFWFVVFSSLWNRLRWNTAKTSQPATILAQRQPPNMSVSRLISPCTVLLEFGVLKFRQNNSGVSEFMLFASPSWSWLHSGKRLDHEAFFHMMDSTQIDKKLFLGSRTRSQQKNLSFLNFLSCLDFWKNLQSVHFLMWWYHPSNNSFPSLQQQRLSHPPISAGLDRQAL